jgi:autotransporter-associated beta strand protein
MKKFLITACALLACASSLQAQLYWDLNGTGDGAGTTPTGTWDASTANWNTEADGFLATEAWTPGSEAIFSAVTVSGVQEVDSIIIEEGGPTFSGGSLTNLGVVNVATAMTNSTTSISGTNILIKRGPGSLRMNPLTNTYTGGTRLEEGTLVISTSTQFGASTAPLILAGGTLDSPNIANRTINNPVVFENDTLISGFTSTAAGTRFVAFSSGNVTNIGGTITLRNTGIAGTFFSVRFREGGITIDRPIVLGQVGDAGTTILRMDNLT